MRMLVCENHVNIYNFFYWNATCCFLARYFVLPSIYLAAEHFRECLFSALAPLKSSKTKLNEEMLNECLVQ